MTFGASNKKRFEEIIKGRVRRDLKDIIKNYELIKPKKEGTISIPLPHAEIPRFKKAPDEEDEGEPQGGVGQGPGNVGDKLFPSGQGDEDGDGPKAGEGEGQHSIEVEVTLEELAKIMQDELELPNIAPKGKKRIYTTFDRYSGLRKVGPDALLRIEPTFKHALMRTIASEEYDPDDPIITIRKEDMRYRSWKTTTKPESDAVLIYMMDVSGSMTERHKAIARLTSFWIDTFLRSQYKGIESIYIIHDTSAKQVNYHEFYHTSTGGGTRIASAYELCDLVINQFYNPDEWNIYCFQWSDGDNWGNNNDEFKMLDSIIPKVNLFCYGQIDVGYGYYYRSTGVDSDIEGKYLSDMKDYIEKNPSFEEKIRTSKIKNESDIYETLKIFLGTGK